MDGESGGLREKKFSRPTHQPRASGSGDRKKEVMRTTRNLLTIALAAGLFSTGAAMANAQRPAFRGPQMHAAGPARFIGNNREGNFGGNRGGNGWQGGDGNRGGGWRGGDGGWRGGDGDGDRGGYGGGVGVVYGGGGYGYGGPVYGGPVYGDGDGDGDGAAAYIPPCPGPGYVWTAGYWDDGNWIPGNWIYQGGPAVSFGIGFGGGRFWGGGDDDHRGFWGRRGFERH